MALLEISEEFLNRVAKDRRVSEGELAALKLALTKHKSKDIAAQLNISQAAARKRLGEVYKKFGIKGRGPGKLASLEKTLETDYAQSLEVSNGMPLVNSALQTTSSSASAPTKLSSYGAIHSTAIHHATGWEDTGADTAYYWGSAPSLNAFAGRRQPLEALEDWIAQPAAGVKLLAVCGIGGIGKTHFVRKLAEDVGNTFYKVVWLKVDKARPPEDLLRSLQKTLQDNKTLPLRRLSYGPQASSTSQRHESIDRVIQQIVRLLTHQRSLVVLDKFDAAFKSYLSHPKEPTDEGPSAHVSRQQQASRYREGFEIYGKLLTAIKQNVGSSGSNLQSCLIVTSREKPKEMLSFLEKDADGKLYVLEGLDSYEATTMLERFHLVGDTKDYWDLAARYCGHPMALRLAANTVKDVFDGSIRSFLDQDISVFDDLRGMLKSQFNKLPPTEQEAMYWLAINLWPCSLEDLQADIVAQERKQNLLYTLRSLEHRSLVQVNQQHSSVLFHLHPIVAEYILDRFIRAVVQDLIRGQLTLFNAYALMKADAEEELRERQIKIIVQPILVRLKNHYKSLDKVDSHLSQRLNEFRDHHPGRLGYAGGNFLNLLVQLSHGTLQKRDFSKLTIWQAYLQGTQMRDVNFNQCALNRSIFTETLSDVLSVALSPSSQQNKNQISKMHLLCAGDTSGFVHLWNTRWRGPSNNRESRLQEAFQARANRNSSEGTSEGSQKQTEWLAHQSWVRAVAFVPNQPLLVTGGDDSQLKLWRLPAPERQVAGAVEQVWQKASGDRIYAVAVSHNGKIIASGGDDKITLYHTRTGRLIDRIPKQAADKAQLPVVDLPHNPHKSAQHNRVRALTFSPDGQWLASCGDDCIIRLWAVKDISQDHSAVAPAVELKGHQDLVSAVSFSADGTRLVSGSVDERIIVWQIAKDLEGTAEENTDLARAPAFKRIKTLRHVGGNVRSIAISPEGDYFASGGDGAQVRLWDMATLKPIEAFSTQTSRIWSLDFQQQGDRLLLSAGGDKQQLMLWQIFNPNVESGVDAKQTIDSRLIRTYRGYTNSLRSIAYLSDRKIVGGGDSGSLSIWDIQTGDRTATLSRHHGRIWSVAVDTKSARIASASDDSTIRLWDGATGQDLNTLTGHSNWVRAIAFSRHGRLLASAGDDRTLRIWNPLSGGCIKILEGSEHWIYTVGFNPTNSRYVITGGDEQAVRHWDRKDGTYEFCTRHEHRVCSVAYSPDGTLIASGGDDAAVILWDVGRKEIVHRLAQPTLGIKSVAFSANGKYLAAGGEDQVVYVWDLDVTDPNERCLELGPQEYTGLAGGIRSVTFSPDSQYVVSGGLDEMIRKGDLRQMDELSALGELDAGVLTPLIQRDRPYENIEIKGVKGLNDLQMANLVTLGAISRSKSLLS